MADDIASAWIRRERAAFEHDLIASNPHAQIVIEPLPGGRWLACFNAFPQCDGDSAVYEPQAEGNDLEEVKKRAMRTILATFPNKREFEFLRTDGKRIVEEEIIHV